jgi:hypothetical protein
VPNVGATVNNNNNSAKRMSASNLDFVFKPQAPAAAQQQVRSNSLTVPQSKSEVSRTPQPRRKDTTSSRGSPAPTSTKRSRQPSSSSSSSSKALRASPSGHSLSPSGSRPWLCEETDPRQKRFELLWSCGRVEHGMVRVPPQMLAELISGDDIDKYFVLEEKPVAR